MKILITGAEGYIGALLAPFLLERGYEVVGLDTGFYREGWLYRHGVTMFPPCISKDIRHVTEEDLQGFDTVIHLAELSNDPLGQHTPEITYQINHVGSVELAGLCKKVGITRFIYTSSCSVYGIGSDDYKTEHSETNPQTAYAICKVLVERDVSAMADDDFSPTFLRNATAYGPSPRMRFDIVLNNLAGLAWTTRQVKMTSNGTPWRPLVHVLDICEAIVAVLEAPREVVHNQIFNVGSSEENYRVSEIAQIVAETFPGCTITLGTNDGDNRSYRVSFDKIHTQLPGFQCRRNATVGALQLHAVFERIGMSHDIFAFRAYTRLQQLEHLISTRQIDDQFFWE
jgi:nucleoside-diphosphate-sugar epimerase